MIGRNHDRKAFRGDLIDDALAGLKAVETAQVVRNDVDSVDLVDGHLRAVDDRLCLCRFFGIRRPSARMETLGVHQPVHRDLTALATL
jgi:hypothetical protein